MQHSRSMDPTETWNMMLAAYADDDWQEGRDHAGDLLHWLERGGFTPLITIATATRPQQPDAILLREIVQMTCRHAIDTSWLATTRTPTSSRFTFWQR